MLPMRDGLPKLRDFLLPKWVVGAVWPRSTRQIGAWIEKEFGLVYESRSGLIALLHRLGLKYFQPDPAQARRREAKCIH
jgi:transposase